MKNQQLKSEKHKQQHNNSQSRSLEQQPLLQLADSSKLLEKCEVQAQPSINLVEKPGSTPVYEEKNKQKQHSKTVANNTQNPVLKQSSQESNVRRQESTKSILKTPVSKTNSSKQNKSNINSHLEISQKQAETMTDLMKSANLMKVKSTLSRNNSLQQSTSKIEPSQTTSPKQINNNTVCKTAL